MSPSHRPSIPFRIPRSLSLLAIALGLAGCMHSMGHFSVVSDRNVSSLDSISSSPATHDRVTGQSCQDFVLFVPVSSRRDLDDAFADAVQKTPGTNALSDVTVKRDGFFTFFFNERCYKVEGTPIKLGK